MLGSYGSRKAVLQALSVLAGSGLSPELRERVIEDTLRGAPGAKQDWTESGVVQDVSAGLDAVTAPVTVVIGGRDRVEHERALREVFSTDSEPMVLHVLARHRRSFRGSRSSSEKRRVCGQTVRQVVYKQPHPLGLSRFALRQQPERPMHM